MKKINSGFKKSLLPMEIFIDDLKEIESLLTKNATDFKLRTKEYEYDSVDELFEHKKGNTIKELSIYATSPKVLISLSPSDGEIYVAGDNIQSTGMFFSIENIFKKRYLGYPLFSWIYNYPSVILIMLIIHEIETTQWFVNFIRANIFNKFIFITIIASFAIGFIHILYTRIASVSKIILEYKDKKNNFLKRNKDQVVMTMLSFCLGIIGTLLVQILLHSLNIK